MMKMYSDEEKKAIERINYIQDFIIENGQYNADISDMHYFSKILNLMKKQDKIINEMAEEFSTKTLMYCDWTKEDIIKYFEEKVKENK